jgi:hypothetical protein
MKSLRCLAAALKRAQRPSARLRARALVFKGQGLKLMQWMGLSYKSRRLYDSLNMLLPNLPFELRHAKSTPTLPRLLQ